MQYRSSNRFVEFPKRERDSELILFFATSVSFLVFLQSGGWRQTMISNSCRLNTANESQENSLSFSSSKLQLKVVARWTRHARKATLARTLIDYATGLETGPYRPSDSSKSTQTSFSHFISLVAPCSTKLSFASSTPFLPFAASAASSASRAK